MLQHKAATYAIPSYCSAYERGGVLSALLRLPKVDIPAECCIGVVPTVHATPVNSFRGANSVAPAGRCIEGPTGATIGAMNGGHLQWTEAVSRIVSITQVGLMASQNRCENIEKPFQWHATCTVRQEEHRSFFIRLWFMRCEHERLPHGVRGTLSNTLTTYFQPPQIGTEITWSCLGVQSTLLA
jgi:hypothetical protein